MKDQVNIENARNPDQIEALKKIQEGSFCPFCSQEYMAKEHGKPILVDGKYWFATENRWPYKGARVHLLLVHKEHITNVSELSKEAWGELLLIVKELKGKVDVPGGTLLMRFGDTKYTGGTVAHLHAQLISGNKDSSEPVLVRVG